jgi:hypothetical protein
MTRTQAAICGFLFVATTASAAPEEMYSSNGVNEMVLTAKECPLEQTGFPYYAYVLEEEMTVAEGCWQRYEGYVDIWIPAIKSHFQLKEEEFKRRATM